MGVVKVYKQINILMIIIVVVVVVVIKMIVVVVIVDLARTPEWAAGLGPGARRRQKGRLLGTAGVIRRYA